MIRYLFESLILGLVALFVCYVIARVAALISDRGLQWIYYVFIIIMILGYLIRCFIGGI